MEAGVVVAKAFDRLAELLKQLLFGIDGSIAVVFAHSFLSFTLTIFTLSWRIGNRVDGLLKNFLKSFELLVFHGQWVVIPELFDDALEDPDENKGLLVGHDFKFKIGNKFKIAQPISLTPFFSTVYAFSSLNLLKPDTSITDIHQKRADGGERSSCVSLERERENNP